MESSTTSSFLPRLAFSHSSIDFSSDSETTTNSETTTLNDRHDSLKESPRSSICSDRSSNSSPTTSKAPKRVRFQDSVCWSYFDDSQNSQHDEDEITPPAPVYDRKPSFIGRSWQRFKSRNASCEFDVSSPSNLRGLQRNNYSMDGITTKVSTSASGRPTLSRRSHSSPTTTTTSSSYSIQLPLRESAGRRFNAAQTPAIWRADTAKTKGDWGDLLSNPRQSRLYG